LLSLIVYGLSAVTLAAIVSAPWLVELYAPGFTASQHGLIVSAIVLRRRLGRIDGHRLLRTHVKVGLAAGGAAAAAWVAVPLHGPALVTLAVGGAVGAAVYLVAARLVRLTEVRQLAGIAWRT
jgi:putative peptidoglycan lipid II flippase